MNYFIRKMMEQERDFRYGSMGELIDDIEQQIRGKKTMIFRAGGGDDDELLDRPFHGDGGSPPRVPPKSPRR
jgi:hypothetical protein